MREMTSRTNSFQYPRGHRDSFLSSAPSFHTASSFRTSENTMDTAKQDGQDVELVDHASSTFRTLPQPSLHLSSTLSSAEDVFQDTVQHAEFVQLQDASSVSPTRHIQQPSTTSQDTIRGAPLPTRITPIEINMDSTFKPQPTSPLIQILPESLSRFPKLSPHLQDHTTPPLHPIGLVHRPSHHTVGPAGVSLIHSRASSRRPSVRTEFPRRVLSSDNISSLAYASLSHQLNPSYSADHVEDEEEDRDRLAQLPFMSEDEDEGVKARQNALNREHPFGLPLWKPALYKKSRSVQREADQTIHARPTDEVRLEHFRLNRRRSRYFPNLPNPFNLVWFFLFGWWSSLVVLLWSFVLVLVPNGGRDYARLLRGLAWYLFWPFGRFVERVTIRNGSQDEEWSSDRWASGVGDTLRRNWERLQSAVVPARTLHDEDATVTEPLLSSSRIQSTYNFGPWSEEDDEDPSGDHSQTTLANRRSSFTFGEFVYRIVFYVFLAPMLFGMSLINFFLIFTVPMAKLSYGLLLILADNPLSIRFGRARDATLAVAADGVSTRTGRIRPPHRILLCTYHAMGWKYYKYTFDGVNIMFFNLLSVVVLVIVARYVIGPWTDFKHPLSQPGVLFLMALFSVIPLAYFIGMAVSSISAQSSLGVGAVINATFGSAVEIVLYALSIMQGKTRLVQGTLIGNFLAGLLLMPGLSMVAGSVKRKEQRFNVKSANVTGTVLILSLIGVFCPTLFHQIYGTV